MNPEPKKEKPRHRAEGNEGKAPAWVPRGARCRECGHIYYPPKRVCLTCRRRTEMETIPLSRRGVLYTYSVIHVGGLDGFHTPYTVGWVTLPEGIRLFGPIDSGGSESPLRIGMPVEMVLHPLPTADGSLEDGFAFQPLAGC